MFPDVHATFSTLTAWGVHIGIATNGPPDVVEAVLQHCGVRQFVHCIITPARAGAVKPAQAFAIYVVAQTGVAPRQIMCIGDRAEDIMTGKHIGATTVLVDRGAAIPLEVTPAYIVQTLSDILPLCLSAALERWELAEPNPYEAPGCQDVAGTPWMASIQGATLFQGRASPV